METAQGGPESLSLSRHRGAWWALRNPAFESRSPSHRAGSRGSQVRGAGHHAGWRGAAHPTLQGIAARSERLLCPRSGLSFHATAPFERLGWSPVQARVHWKLTFSIPSSRLSLKMPLCFCRKETQFWAKRQGWASFLVNMPDESQPWESSSGDRFPHWGRTHMWAQTFAGAPPNALDGPPPSRGRVRRE